MTEDQIFSLGPQLADFLDEFADCFGRSEPRGHLASYIRGQLSELPRKNVEQIANYMYIVPRTLQEFLRTDQWDHERLCDRVQEIVLRDHADVGAIGIIDDSGHPKSGEKIPGISRQYCGNTGKVDNCVVTVHLCYSSFDTQFRTVIGSAVYLPKSWDDPERREEAGIPEEVVYRPKYDIALAELDRAHANGVYFAWVTADEWYAQKPRFVSGLEDRHLRYVLELPRNFRGWFYCPEGRLADNPAKSIENLVRYSGYMNRQPWQRFHVKDTQKGPAVWEAKAAPFWLRRDGLVLGPYWLIWVRNVLDPTDEKYFLSNAAPGTPLEVLLHVAFSRWPIERCLQDEKDRLGLSEFEVRTYQSVCRHLYVTQVSHLFLARQTSRLRGEKSGHHSLPSTRRSRCNDRCPASLYA